MKQLRKFKKTVDNLFYLGIVLYKPMSGDIGVPVPHKAPRPCRMAGCLQTTHSPTGYCDSHLSAYVPFIPRKEYNRISAATRGYNAAWQHIREETLRNYGIPKDEWPLYDLHHTPDYNPAIEPDHRKYTLTPLLHADHSRHTGKKRKKVHA
jgi:hypothetical protein